MGFRSLIINNLTKMPSTIKTKRKFNFKIGADPEFVMTMQGKKVDAKQTMELMLKKKKGFVHDSKKKGFEVAPFGNIGWDGASSTAEVRPKPSEEPQIVTSNLGGMFKKLIKHIKICDFSTLSEFSSVGGHIHLELKKGEKWSEQKANIVHRKLASFYLPLLISENKTNLNLRLKQGYGSLSDKKIQHMFTYPDGERGHTLEFRCPSAEWLTTPKLANATMAYMAVVYNQIINFPESFKKFSDIVYKSEKQGDALQTLAIMDFDLLTQSILKKAKQYIRTFDMYEEYKNEIEYIFDPKQVIKDKQKAEYNIAIGWKLVKKELPKKREIMSSKKKIKEIAIKRDFDLLKGVVNINYNNDTNVSLYAESLKDRVAAFNWKLKNNYYLFGIRKGIDNIIAKNLKGEYIAGTEIVKTVLDKNASDELFSKMQGKFQNMGVIQNSATIDFITCKKKDQRENMIMIGIPYNMRVKEEIKQFLNLIWNLESKTKAKIPKLTLKDDSMENDKEKRGLIYQALKTPKTEEDKVILDSDSYSMRNHEDAIQETVREFEALEETIEETVDL